MKIKVMLADDHTLVRKGIRLLLESGGDIEVVEEAGDGRECLEKLRKYKDTDSMPQILLLDIFMPEKNGIEVLGEIKKSMPELKVIVLSAHEENHSQAAEMGAAGFLLKSADVSELRKALHQVVQSENISFYTDSDRDNKIYRLTEREKEVLDLVAEGMLNKEIAVCLGISERTVKNHISGIFRKLDVCDRTQAAVYAIQRRNVCRFR